MAPRAQYGSLESDDPTGERDARMRGPAALTMPLQILALGPEVLKLTEVSMTPKNVAIEPELFARVTEEAAAEGTTADEIANEATKRYLALRRLDRLQRYGQKRAEELGITEDDVPRLIAESRAERRR